MHPQPASMPLSRTSSTASISSEEDASMSSSTVTQIGNTRRTRKRFTNAQLTMLENLFHQNSHPSREDREAVAHAGAMEIKSVTIWFQNKRQTERKSAQAGHPDHLHSPNVVPNITSTLHTFSLHNADLHTTASPTFSRAALPPPPRPTLDRVASRSELRVAAPRTPSRRPHPADAGPPIWDNMPSSPLAPPISPPAREFIDFGKHAKTRRTLEWACAAARLADKDGYASGMSAGFSGATPSASTPRERDARDRAREWDRQRDTEYRDRQTLSRDSDRSYDSISSRSSHSSGHREPDYPERKYKPSLSRDSDHSYDSISSARSSAGSSQREPEYREREYKPSIARDSDRSYDSFSSGARSSAGSHYQPQQIQPHHGRTVHRQQSRVYIGKERERDPAATTRVRVKREEMEIDLTDEDDDQEAITPPGTWGKDDKRWRPAGSENTPSLTAMANATVTGVLPKGVDDDDMFKAALALCGLGGRRPQ